MGTTQLFVELLIIGFGVVIWLILLIAAVVGYSFGNVSIDTNAFALAPILAISYILGIVIDRIAYSLFSRGSHRIRDKIIPPQKSISADHMERFVLNKSEVLNEKIEYNRSRRRICRSWIINFFLIAFGMIFWAWRIKTSKIWEIIILAVLSIGFGILTYLVYKKLTEDFYINIKDSYEYLKGENKD